MSNTITLTLEGDVPFAEFAKATNQFYELVVALTAEVSPEVKIQWVVDDLEIGSAETTVRGGSTTPKCVEAVAEAYMQVGDALAGCSR